MINLLCPTDDAEETYLRCARRTRGDALRAALIAQSPRVAERAALYRVHALHEQLYMLTPEAPTQVDKAKFATIYDRILVSGSERSHYNRLLEAPRHKRCPYCGQREVRTLDHYLPKNVFPEYGLYYANLVPCCSDCNKKKHEHRPIEYETQFFHPYFDRWGEYDLIEATIMINESLEIRYSTSKPNNLSEETFRRVQFHFERLGLAELYEKHAAVEMVQKKKMFRNTFSTSGSEALRLDLLNEEDSRRTPFFRNAWQPALYRALARFRTHNQ